MGVFDCKKHGITGFIDVCSHIDKDLKNGMNLSKDEFIPFFRDKDL